ncbi:MAG: hypothetical protein WBV78_17285 [Roseobacter sp.]
MRLLRHLTTFALLAMPAAGVSAQQLPTGSGHALTVYASCQAAELDPGLAISQLNALGWRDVSEVEVFRRTVNEIANIKARTLMSERSYPNHFQKTQSDLTENALTYVRRAVDSAVFEQRGSFQGDESARLVFVVQAPEDEAVAIIDFFRGADYSQLICETATSSVLNPALTALLLADDADAATRGAAFERWRTSGPEVNYAYLLSEHAQQKDDRFETASDLVLRSVFVVRAN